MQEERRERRRIGALLGAYYGIEGADKSASTSAVVAPQRPEAPLDQEEFDAKKHFDSLVATGLVADVVRHANEIDSEVRDLDGDMNMVVYENYSKFIRSMEVTKQMKMSMEEMEPDLEGIEGNFTRISKHQRSVEEGVSGRAGQIEALLKQQRICKKLQVLFDLPKTLQRCLDQGAYGRAVQAYCTCAGFLRQHKKIPTLQSVLQDVEHQMGRIRSALDQRLRSAELSVEEAINCGVTLLDLGQEPAEVESNYLNGRAAVLRTSVEACFAWQPSLGREDVGAGNTEAVSDNGDAAAAHLRVACTRAGQRYLPELTSVVKGFQRLRESQAAPGDFAEDVALGNFVTSRIHDLLDRVTNLVESKHPPAEVLVSCVTTVKEAMQTLQALLPTLMTKLLGDFSGIIVTTAMKALSSEAMSNLTSDFVNLHSESKRLQESRSGHMDALLDHAAKTEQSLAAYCLTAIGSCQSLGGLASERAAGQRLARGLQDVMIAVLLTFAKVCWVYCGQEPKVDATLPAALRATPQHLQESIGELEWVGCFGLALVWIGRRWEEKVVGKVVATARELLVGIRPPAAAERELVPERALAKATTAAAEAAMAHFVLVSGHHVAHHLQNTVQSRDWLEAQEPREPGAAVETVLKEVNAFDNQLGRILGDPRKPRGGAHRRNFNDHKTSMELELEWMMAKKLQAFAPIPFTRKGAVAGILRIAFKALYEYVREQTFGKFGLQQMQVDTNLLAEIVRDFVDTEDATALGSLLSEVVHSASQRSIEPVLMDERAVEALCDKKKNGLKLDQ